MRFKLNKSVFNFNVFNLQIITLRSDCTFAKFDGEIVINKKNQSCWSHCSSQSNELSFFFYFVLLMK